MAFMYLSAPVSCKAHGDQTVVSCLMGAAGPLQEQSVFLTAKPFLQPQNGS